MVDFNDQYRMTIAGCLLAGTETFKAFNPATKKAIADVPNASAAQLDEAVTSARAAFATWRHSSFEQRRDALNGIAEVLERHAEDFMALLTKEQGKPRADAEWEIVGSAIWCREIAQASPPERGDRRDARSGA